MTTIASTDELGAIVQHLGRAHSGLEELLAAVRAGDKTSIEGATPDHWILDGFTTDALLDITGALGIVLDIREKINGGSTADEIRLKDALGDG
jgi:hypothetical protein